MNIDHSTYTNRGGRPINEDSLFCRSDCFLVADGLGGHENGEVASAQAVNYISGNYSGNIGDEELSRLLAGADEAVRSDGEDGKSTLAALFFSEDKARFANVGDSRVYYFRQGKIFARTKDHSVCQAAVEMGELALDEVRSSDDRSGLFKVLGASQPLKVPKPYEPIPVRDGDAFLLCSDGFWEYVYEMEMEADLLKSESAAQWLRHMVKRLLLRSGNSGDNYTAICGIIHAPEAPASVKRRVCSPVLIACLAVSLAALGTMTAIRLAAPDGSVPAEVPQPALETAEASETRDSAEPSTAQVNTAQATQTAEAVETRDSAEHSAATAEVNTAQAAEPSVTEEQTPAAEPTTATEPIQSDENRQSVTGDVSQESTTEKSSHETEPKSTTDIEVITND